MSRPIPANRRPETMPLPSLAARIAAEKFDLENKYIPARGHGPDSLERESTIRLVRKLELIYATRIQAGERPDGTGASHTTKRTLPAGLAAVNDKRKRVAAVHRAVSDGYGRIQSAYSALKSALPDMIAFCDGGGSPFILDSYNVDSEGWESPFLALEHAVARMKGELQAALDVITDAGNASMEDGA